MKGIKSTLAVFAIVALCLSGVVMGETFGTAFASDSVNIGDLLKEGETSNTTTQAPEATTGTDNSNSSVTEKQNSIIDTITDNMDYSTPESDQVKRFGELVQKVTSYIVQGLTYVFTGLLIIHKMIDLFYVGIPFTRTVLANGYMGNAAAAGTQAQSMNPGMNSGMMGGGFGGGGFGGGGFGGGYGGRYGGMGGMGMGGSMMSNTDAQMASQNQPARGRLQLVSNAALNAVATESVIGPDGKGQSAFKIYTKEMLISLIVAPILLVLCITGAISKVGFGIGSLLADVLTKIKF